jgi:hypothetical protein
MITPLIFVYLFLGITIFLILGLLLNKISLKQAYLYQKRKIRWGYVLKLWATIQIFSIILANRPFYSLRSDFLFILGIPIIIVYLIIVCSLFYIDPQEGEINTEEFNKYRKSIERNKKLEKLIK